MSSAILKIIWTYQGIVIRRESTKIQGNDSERLCSLFALKRAWWDFCSTTFQALNWSPYFWVLWLLSQTVSWIESLLSSIYKTLVLSMIFVGILKLETSGFVSHLKNVNLKQNIHVSIQFKKLSLWDDGSAVLVVYMVNWTCSWTRVHWDLYKAIGQKRTNEGVEEISASPDVFLDEGRSSNKNVSFIFPNAAPISPTKKKKWKSASSSNKIHAGIESV